VLFDTTAYLAWRAVGGAGVQLLQASLLALTLALVHIACRVRAPAVAAFAIWILGLVVLEPRALPRPISCPSLRFAACALLIERAARTIGKTACLGDAAGCEVEQLSRRVCLRRDAGGDVRAAELTGRRRCRAAKQGARLP
jgi:hypothetical protein